MTAAAHERCSDTRPWLVWIVLLGSALHGCGPDAHAAIRLPRLVSDNMVLQRDAPLTLWGSASPGERIVITFRGARFKARANAQRHWQVTLPPQAAGGPFDMKLRGMNKKPLVLKNVLLGDVWLASGQSNMQFTLVRQGDFGGVIDAAKEQRGANFPRIRLYQLQRTEALTPATDAPASGWRATTPDSVADFSAIAYLFGRELHQRYDIPIGLIDATWGGTPAETWISAGSLREFPDMDASVKRAAALPPTAAKDYEVYLKAKTDWYQAHGHDDRGRADGKDLWAALNFDDSRWPTVNEPRPSKVVPNFDGTLWLRKAINVPANRAGQDIHVHLCNLLKSDTTFFNGHVIGQTQQESAERDYEVPAALVMAGRNVITVRLEGEQQSGDGFVGMHGDAADLYVDLNGSTVSLAGGWSYQTGPDLSELPKPPLLTEFRKTVPQAPTLLFNGMVAPLTPYRIKGVIWYQGEANVGRAAQYRTLFPTLIKDWRAAWGYDVPFLFVQLAGFGHDRPEPARSAWAELREAQAAALTLPQTAMATAVDVGDENDVHPKNKQAVAHRLALAAQKMVYRSAVAAAGPAYKSMQIDGDDIRIHFSDIGGGLKVADPKAELRGFAVAAQTGDFVWAVARIEGDTVIVNNPSLQDPVAVRYDWSNTPQGNLVNKEGLPALPFRTDQGP